MGLIVRDNELLKIGRNTEVSFCRLMAKELLNCEGITALTINLPDPVLNLVIDTEVNESQIHSKIPQVIEFYKQRGCLWTWVIGPLAKPANLPQHLERHGFTYLESYPGMHFDLSHFESDFDLSQFDLEELAPGDQLNEWIKPIRESFPSRDNSEGYRAHCATIAHGPGTPLRHYVAKKHGEVVSALTLYLTPDAVMIHNLATKIDSRNQGFGKALTIYTMLEAKKLGYKHCFLDSSEDGYNLYFKLGFRVYATNHVYGLRSLLKQR